MMEYLVKISKKARILELKRRHLKITVLTSNTSYQAESIHRIQVTRRKRAEEVLQLHDKEFNKGTIYDFKDPEQEFRSSRKLFKTPIDLFSDLKEYYEEEVAKTMTKTMEQYMSKTRADYGFGIARPKINDKDHFELKGQFLKELHDNTFSGSDHEDANEHIKKVLEIVDLFHIPNINQNKVMLRTFPISLIGFLIRWLRNKPSSSITTWEDLKTKDAGGPHYTKDFPLKEEGKTLEEAYYTQIGGPVQEGGYSAAAPDRTMKYPKGIAENVLVGIGKFVFPIDFIILAMPDDVKVPLILRRTFLSTAYAKIDVFKRNITLRVGNEKNIFKSVKPATSLIKRVYMLSLRERMELDLDARLMGESLVLNRSLDPLYVDYIELNYHNVPLELRRDQVDDLMPTIEEVMENMNGYRDQRMGDIILGEPFCKASCVEAIRFDGLITIHNGSDNVTYQMARSYPRFENLYNAQCNKIKLLLKDSNMSEIRRGKNGSHTGTLTCMRWSEESRRKGLTYILDETKVLPGRQPEL
uniref:Reverse transcriptase domain-containing protein n=1 Tax=Tanacetum cinerariifolium TaxID=118510 RepID=A0A6L2L8U4_TANCI|nr:hypothetical protein CTI12_AA085190 [Tanacetum cinerariifolium]